MFRVAVERTYEETMRLERCAKREIYDRLTADWVARDEILTVLFVGRWKFLINKV